MEVLKIMVFRTFCKGQDSSWSSCYGLDKENTCLLIDTLTIRLESCSLVSASTLGFAELMLGTNFPFSVWNYKKSQWFQGYLWDNFYPKRCFSPHFLLLPLSLFSFLLGKHISFCSHTSNLEHPPRWNCCAGAVDLEIIGLASIQHQRSWLWWTTRNMDIAKPAQKAEVVHTYLPRFCLLLLPLVQVIPLLTHALMIELLFLSLSPKLSLVAIVLCPRTFPHVTSLWTKEMTVSYSLALFCNC